VVRVIRCRSPSNRHTRCFGVLQTPPKGLTCKLLLSTRLARWLRDVCSQPRTPHGVCSAGRAQSCLRCQRRCAWRTETQHAIGVGAAACGVKRGGDDAEEDTGRDPPAVEAPRARNFPVTLNDEPVWAMGHAFGHNPKQ